MYFYLKTQLVLFIFFTSIGAVFDDKIKKVLEHAEDRKTTLINQGVDEQIAKAIAEKLISDNLMLYENQTFYKQNKELIKEFQRENNSLQRGIENELKLEQLSEQYSHENKLFDEEIKYKKSLDNKKSDYEADRKAIATAVDIEEYEKARLRGIDNALKGNQEKDRFGRTTPSAGEVLNNAIWNQIVPAVLNPYQLLKATAIVGAAGGATYFLGWCVPSITKKYLENIFITPRPTILLPGSKIGRWDRFMRWKNGYKSPEMIFPTQVYEQLNDLVGITQMIKKDIKTGLKRSYRNVMLWGPPGTGKTLFANVIADKLNMDFCSITAGSLLQKEVGIQFLNEFEKMARKSKYGMILFIDEADALFVDRNTLNIGSEQGLEHYKVLNHLLALTGDGSDKFMLIAATNHAQNIDEAMGRRFQERIYMPLPDVQTREKLVNLYIKKLLYSESNNGSAFVKHAKRVITPALVKDFVKQTEGLSGAELKDIIAQIQNLGLQTKNKQITIDHVLKALKQGIQKRKDQDNDVEKRKEIAQNKGTVVQLTVCPTNGNNVDVQSSVPIVSTDIRA